MSIPYESTGRTRQKQRTRDALVAATQTLLAQDATPTVEAAADAAGISRTTAYRYFANQRALLLAAIPEIDRTSMLDAGAPDDVATRVDLVITAQTKILRDWEPQLRAALRLSLEPELSTPPSERSVLRQGRAFGWIIEALEPLATTHPQIDSRRLAIAIRATCGIEAMVWLTDVARLSRRDASSLMRSSAQALLSAALATSSPN
jgi:AcrR family transcriptional regulator